MSSLDHLKDSGKCDKNFRRALWINSSNTGDFPGILGEVLAPRLLNLDGERGKWKVKEVNKWLTDLPNPFLPLYPCISYQAPLL